MVEEPEYAVKTTTNPKSVTTFSHAQVRFQNTGSGERQQAVSGNALDYKAIISGHTKYLKI